MTKYELREKLADYAHDSWSGWAEYMLDLCQPMADGSMNIPKEHVDRWLRQIDTPYRYLSSEEQKSDLHEADIILKIVLPTIDSLNDKVHSLGKKLEDNEKDLNLLYHLQAAGVDNWEGYGVACDMMNEANFDCL